jgi:hypothetical protein
MESGKMLRASPIFAPAPALGYTVHSPHTQFQGSGSLWDSVQVAKNDKASP